MSATERYRAARDQLVSLRGDHEAAMEQFSWPDVGDRFNWAVDWFDAIARGNDRPALVVAEEDGSSRDISFDAMTARSDRVAAWLANEGVRKGDPVMLMLGNQVELWDLMLAVIKLGAVIMPTATAAGAADLTDRVERGGARFVVTNADQTAKFVDVPGDYGRICTQAVDGWSDLRAAYDAANVKRAELHDGSPVTLPTGFHALRGLFVTEALARGMTETWVADRTGHASTQMIARYQRRARAFAEANMTPLAKLNELLATELATPTERGGRFQKRFQLVGHEGLEPSANGLRVHCSTN